VRRDIAALRISQRPQNGSRNLVGADAEKIAPAERSGNGVFACVMRFVATVRNGARD
jgi:hypothetical protein